MKTKSIRAVVLGTDIDNSDIRLFPITLKFESDFYVNGDPIFEMQKVTDAIAETIQDHSNIHFEIMVKETDPAFLAFDINWPSAFELDLTYLK